MRVDNASGSHVRQRKATSVASCRISTSAFPQPGQRSRVGRQPASSRRVQPSATASSANRVSSRYLSRDRPRLTRIDTASAVVPSRVAISAWLSSST